MIEDKKYPLVAAGAFILNNKNELLLIKAPRWDNKYTIAGGKIEMGETVFEALRREIKEETNLEIGEIKLLQITDGLNLEKFNNNNYKHLLFINYVARSLDPENIKLSSEGTEYKWLSVDDWLKKDQNKFPPYIYENIQKLKDFIDEENISDYKLLYQRALADYQNLIKQTTKEKADFIKYATQNLLHDLIPAYDNLKIAIKHADEKNHDSWLEGVKYVAKQFKDALENNGVEEIKTVGEKFDHHTMDATQNEDTDNKKQDGLVAKELKAGYKLNGKVVIPARVIVYKLKVES